MRAFKIILSLFMMLSVQQFGSAQDYEVPETGALGSDIFGFINSLNDDIDSFFKKEKTHKFKRQLGYFKNDLKKYLKTRIRLTVYLEAHDYNMKPGKANRKLRKLKKELDKLSSRLLRIIPHISPELSTEAEQMVEDIEYAILDHTGLYITELDKLLKGQKTDKEKLKKERDSINSRLVRSTELITIIQDKIKAKYKSTDQ